MVSRFKPQKKIKGCYIPFYGWNPFVLLVPYFLWWVPLFVGLTLLLSHLVFQRQVYDLHDKIIINQYAFYGLDKERALQCYKNNPLVMKYNNQPPEDLFNLLFDLDYHNRGIDHCMQLQKTGVYHRDYKAPSWPFTPVIDATVWIAYFIEDVAEVVGLETWDKNKVNRSKRLEAIPDPFSPFYNNEIKYRQYAYEIYKKRK